jgi:3-hydroxyisobutyrate dehydrogenase-like beta-hydroxyacid dehydrogenase
MAIQSIGFIGLGEMGFPMAKRLCGAGFEVRTAIHRADNPQSVERAAQLAALGAKIKESFAAAVTGADLILTILPEDEQVKGILLDREIRGAIVANPAAIILEMTSCRPATVQEIGAAYAQSGVRVFDAPVSGGVAGAANGTLTIFGAGDPELLDELRPVLERLAAKIYHLGELGAGKALKAVNQMLAAVNMVAVGEAYQLAGKAGIDPKVMYEVIKESSGNSYVFDRKFQNLVSDSFPAGFRLSLMRKDVRIALALAEGAKLPLAELAYQLYDDAREYDGFDFSAIAKRTGTAVGKPE